MKKLISLIGLSLMLTNVAFAQDLLNCADFEKLGPTLHGKIQTERTEFEKKLISKLVNRAAKEGRLSEFERQMMQSDAEIALYERNNQELDRSIKCSKDKIKEIESRINELRN
jgi:hypothetical protein